MKKSLPLLLLLLLCVATPGLRAFVRDEAPVWKDGTVRLQLHLGNSKTYSDGTTPDGTALEALGLWNPYMARVQLAGTANAPGSASEKNQLNDISFRSDIYGEAFDSNTLAVTITYYTDAERVESDIVVNTNYSWDAYRGALSANIDLRRVLAHELGHVLGLDHPDEHAQWSNALMNSRISDQIETPQEDDQDGVAFMYGFGPSYVPRPPVLADNSPLDHTIVEGQSILFGVFAVQGTRPCTFQWYKDGVAIPGATSSDYSIQAAQLSDAGRYHAVVTNMAGATSSQTAILSVTPAVPPAFPEIVVETVNISLGEPIFISAVGASSGTPPISYQWYRNGVPVAGATDYYFSKKAATAEDAGEYAIEASNFKGSARALVKRIVIVQTVPPSSTTLSCSFGGYVGNSISFQGSATTSNYSTPSYELYKDGALISKSSYQTFSIPKAQLEDGGEYCLVTRNAGGAEASRTLVIDPRIREPAESGWTGCCRAGNVVYFILPSPARIERFDLAAMSWLPSFPLGEKPTAIAASNDHIFVALGKELHRYSHALTQPLLLYTNPENPIYGIACLEDATILYHASSETAFTGGVKSVSPEKGNVLGEIPSTGNCSENMAVAASRRKIFTCGNRLGANITTYLNVGKDGSLSIGGIYDYYLYNLTASRYFVSPDERWVAANSGLVSSTDAPNLWGNFGSYVQDLAFLADGSPITLQRRKLFRWDSYKEENSFFDLGSFDALRIYRYGDKIVAFGQAADGSTPPFREVALSGFAALQSAPAVEPDPASIIPDSSFVANDGFVYLLSKIHRHLFRWNPETQAFEGPHIALRGMPDRASYSPTLNRIYLLYANARVSQIRLDLGETRERFFAATAPPTYLVQPGDRFVLTCEPGYNGGQYKVSDKDGNLLSSAHKYSTYRTSFYAPSARRFLFADGSKDQMTVDWLDVDPSGQLSQAATAPLTSLQDPIVPSADGASFLDGKGRLFDTASMTLKTNFDVSLEDAAWLGGLPFLLSNELAGARIDKRGEGGTLLKSSSGNPGWGFRLLATPGNKLVLMRWSSGLLGLSTFDEELGTNGGAADSPSTLLGLSTRAQVGTGDDVLIPAFVIGGTARKNILVRALGPALAESNVSGFIADPQIELHKVGVEGPIATNDNWSDSQNLSALKDQLVRFYGKTLPDGSRDAALLVSLDPGAYTVVTSGVGGATGVALVEIYDADVDRSMSRLTAIAVRCRTGAGDAVPIAGFTVDGSRNKRIIVQGIGPTLEGAVSGFAPDPRLRLFSGSNVIAENKDWSNSTEVLAAQARAGASSLKSSSKDAALVAELPPGPYTAIVDDESSAGGVALIEVYEIPDK